MNKILPIILVVVLSGCATYEWKHTSGNNSNAAYMESQCTNYARINYPTYVCRIIFACQPDESGIMLTSFTRHFSAITQCMNQNGYRKYEIKSKFSQLWQ